MKQPKTIVISGLRRSGTTALWECFRGSESVWAFDEPFHPALVDGARSNPKGTWVELARFLDQADAPSPVAIAPLEELSSRSTNEQIAYFAALHEAGSHVAIDVVRCWNRLPHLYGQAEDVLTVQLIRDPCTWVTGHLMPSGKGTWRKTFANMYRRASFFSRRGFYDNYHYETIIDAALADGHPIWRAVSMPVEELRKAPAFVKLLAFWWGANLAMYEALCLADAPRMITTLAEFSSVPEPVLDGMSARSGFPRDAMKSGHLKATRASVGKDHAAWERAATALGIPPLLVRCAGANAASLERAFEDAVASGRSAR